MANKGGEFERQLAKQLSLWWTKDERDDVIWRTSQSGGRAKQRAKRAVRTRWSYGDLTFTDPIAQPLFEMLIISAKRGYTNTSKPLQSTDLSKFASECLNICTRKGQVVGKMLPNIKNLTSKLFSRTKKSGGVDLLDAMDAPDKRRNVISDWVKDCEVDAELAQVPYWWLIFRRDGHSTCCMMPEPLHRLLAKLHRMDLTEWGAHNVLISNRLGNQYRLAALEDVLKWCSPKHVTVLSRDLAGTCRVS